MKEILLILAVITGFLGILAYGVSPAYAGSVVYTYDANGRLIKAQYDNGAVIEYAYDPAGNWTSKVVISICEGNSDDDHDVDGSDLAHLANAFDASKLEAFATNFGRTNCP